ncbi:MAG: class I SAM-dependent methyltransferase [Clostridia bacterium]|nr:class I SAM-dependent methyltransferase [Clostridia bacterium]
MRAAKDWQSYRLIDAADGFRLERWGDIILIRPDPQIIWNTPERSPLWKKAHARYHRSQSGGGKWEYYKTLPDRWTVGYGDLTFNIKPMGFKHTGLFPEQAVNWDWMRQKLSGRPGAKVLNMFAYTGGATLACAAAGAAVTHVDASKGMVSWARENAVSSGLSDRPIRWLVDDCFKFVRREIRRGSKYDAVIIDPQSYGRGPGGEVWKLEDSIYDFINDCAELLSAQPLFFVINSYTTGLSPSVMEYMLSGVIKNRFGGSAFSDEIGLPVESSGLILPCGATAIWCC